jgi:hypothetical protein
MDTVKKRMRGLVYFEFIIFLMISQWYDVLMAGMSEAKRSRLHADLKKIAGRAEAFFIVENLC